MRWTISHRQFVAAKIRTAINVTVAGDISVAGRQIGSDQARSPPAARRSETHKLMKVVVGSTSSRLWDQRHLDHRQQGWLRSSVKLAVTMTCPGTPQPSPSSARSFDRFFVMLLNAAFDAVSATILGFCR